MGEASDHRALGGGLVPVLCLGSHLAPKRDGINRRISFKKDPAGIMSLLVLYKMLVINHQQRLVEWLAQSTFNYVHRGRLKVIISIDGYFVFHFVKATCVAFMF